jgi:hypothetical protein
MKNEEKKEGKIWKIEINTIIFVLYILYYTK